MTDHANELRRHADKIGRPAGDTPAVMQAAAAHIEHLERELRAAEIRLHDVATHCATVEAELAEIKRRTYVAVTCNHVARMERAEGRVAEMEAERAEREPVAWYVDDEEGREYNGTPQMSDGRNGIPLYAHPVPAEQLVNERLRDSLRGLLSHFPVPSSACKERPAYEDAVAALAAAEAQQARPAGSLTLDKGDVEFLAARVRRLLDKFGVHEPGKDDRFIVGVAGSLIGNLLTNIELKEKAGMVRLSGDDQPAPVIIEGAPCRNALARDGKPYPKSSCQRCGTLLRSGWKCANGVEI